MSAPAIRGWCPGALRPMESGDGLVVRVCPPAGRLDRRQAEGLAAAAAAHGNGRIDITGRANLQLRGVRAGAHAALVADLAALGLVDPVAGDGAGRRVAVAPFWTDRAEIEAAAAAIAAALGGADAPALPDKFGLALDIGPHPVLRETPADIRVERAPAGELIVLADGARHGAPATLATLGGLVRALAAWFVASGGIETGASADGTGLGGRGGRGRMGRHLAAGAVPPPEFHAIAAASAAGGPPPAPGIEAAGALVGLALGQVTAADFARLGRIAPLRLTPWRMVLLEGARELPEGEGFVTRADDPRRRIIACTGAPACPQGHAETRGLALRLAAGLPGATEGIAENVLLHVSGCEKGCAHPAAAPLTLVATAGGWRLVRGGRAADPGAPVDPRNPEDLMTMTGAR